MEQNINARVGSTLTRIDINDEDGILLGFLKINLTDYRLVTRMSECAAFFKQYNQQNRSAEDLNRDVADRFCYMLGYDCRNTLFGFLNPTDVFEDGTLFAEFILNKITEMFSDSAKKQAEARVTAMRKHIGKYRDS